MEQISPQNPYNSAQPKNNVAVSYTPVSPISQGGYAPPQHNINAPPLSGQPAAGPPKKGLSTSLRWWWPEILASVCAVTAFAAIAGVAGHFRGHSIQDGGLPSGLTLNGLIALLSTIARAALLIPVASGLSQEVWLWLSEARKQPGGNGELRDLEISDEASRGAWGSLLLLRHFRRSWLAHAGAIVTIVSLLFGTFTQQLITIKTFPVTETTYNGEPSQTPGNVPWSSHWGNYSGRPAEGQLSPPMALKAAAYSGIMSSTASPLTANCPTGNCTWPITPSLAICGGCVDSTFDVSCNSGEILSSETFADGGSVQQTAPPSCSYKMPSGYTANITNFALLDMGVGFQVFQSGGFHYLRNDNNTLYLANWEAVGAPANAYSDTQWQNKTTVASECALWMCVQSFDTRQTNSNQTQTVTKSFSQINPRTRQAGLVYNVSFLGLPGDMNQALDDFTVYGGALLALTEYFATLFNGSISLNQAEQIFSSDPVQAIWEASADLDAWLQTVAASMTNVIRTVGQAEPNTKYNGTGFQLGYDVRWAWIVLPAILVGMSLLILVVIMVKTTRSPVQAWKGSPLALLFMNVDHGLREGAMGQLEEYHGVDKLVGKSQVVLTREMDRSWGFKQA